MALRQDPGPPPLAQGDGRGGHVDIEAPPPAAGRLDRSRGHAPADGSKLDEGQFNKGRADEGRIGEGRVDERHNGKGGGAGWDALAQGSSLGERFSYGDSLRRRRGGERKPFHMKLFKTPKEVAGAITAMGSKKGEYSLVRTFGLAVLAGVYLSFGGLLSSVVAGGIPGVNRDNPGLGRLLFGAVFPFGLAMILLYGGELFTSNTMVMAATCMGRKINWRQVATNWVLSWLGNFAGSLLAAYFLSRLPGIFDDDPYHEFVRSLAEKKVNMGWGEVFLRGVGCNYLVNLAVFSATTAEDVAGKYISLWFPITAFVAIGYEHSIANMFFIPNGMMYGADVNVGQLLWRNMIPVTLGNLLSGATFMGAVTWAAYIW
ncbi:unnamed protein product [Ostreobium quekettii]|uniref:Formate/nitrite transporter n=1 Tax=Ostreobium quekettii TaxID=121088 RepID=A0A8S1IZ25_9CHLO|nr:unnamed protein product [Ostreobium quekettii]|eukprot:evm.model.scf_906EXC.5 EVM.evm.TU.scf_906EXC.5   scf_906EXC:41063-45383(+)